MGCRKESFKAALGSVTFAGVCIVLGLLVAAPLELFCLCYSMRKKESRPRVGIALRRIERGAWFVVVVLAAKRRRIGIKRELGQVK